MHYNIDTSKFHDAAAVQAITRLTAFISIMGCSVVAKQCWGLKQQGKLTHMDKLVLVLCLVDLGLAIAWFVGNWSRKDEFACNFQGFWIQFLGLVDILWTDAIAFHIYCLIVLNFTFKRAEKMFKYYLMVTITASLFIATGLWLKDAYSYTSLWCWTTDYHLKFVFFYSFVMATAVFIGLVHFSVNRAIKRDFTSLTNKSYKKDLVHINNKVTQILIIFLVTHFFGLLNRSVEGGTGTTNVWTGVMHALLMPLRGFLNSLVYGLRGRKPPLCCLVLARKLPCIGKIFFFEDDLLEDEAEGYGIDLTRLKATYKEAAIFTTTFNLGECDLESIGDLGLWVPQEGYDVYVIGLQECLCMEELQAALHKHLGGHKRYTMFKQAIGSKQTKLGFHGMISLTVFARTDEVKNGNFVPYEGANSRVVQGVNLGVTKAGNKGAVGLGFRYYDASIGFLTCHFASDSKGKTKLGKRNCDAYNTLREAVLVAENGGFDAHLQHHHTIILGDMNYRVAQPPRLIIEMVAWASIQEKEKTGPNWRVSRYQEFFPDTKGELPIYIPEKEANTIKSGWNTLMSFDELSQMLSNSVVFSGFAESRIRFPPSYRRKRGEEGECGDYTDTAKVSGAFTTQIAGEFEAETTGLRPPSYTDRIISHSLEDKGDFLRKGPYELCDAVKGSDHRPVSQSFFLKVNSAMWGAASIGDLIPMKLTLSGFKIEFNSAPLPSLFDSTEEVEPTAVAAETMENMVGAALAGVLKQPPWKVPGSNGAPGGGTKVYREVDIDTVTVMFPLPAEDPLTHQRKAAELARALGNDQSELLSNVKAFDFDKLQRTQGAAAEIVGKTRPELGLHALVKFCTVLGEELGQGVISLPDPGNRILKLGVEIPLSVGGTLRGKMTAKVAIEQIDFSAALLNGSRSEGGGSSGLEREPLPGTTGGTAQVVGSGGNLV